MTLQLESSIEPWTGACGSHQQGVLQADDALDLAGMFVRAQPELTATGRIALTHLNAKHMVTCSSG